MGFYFLYIQLIENYEICYCFDLSQSFMIDRCDLLCLPCNVCILIEIKIKKHVISHLPLHCKSFFVSSLINFLGQSYRCDYSMTLIFLIIHLFNKSFFINSLINFLGQSYTCDFRMVLISFNHLLELYFLFMKSE